MRVTNVRIRELRKKRGLTQKELAKKISVSPQVVSNWERNYSSLDDEDIKNLVVALDTSADYLLGKEVITEEEDKREISNNNDAIIRELVDKYNIDLSEPNVKEKLEKIIQIVLDDISK